ncbi:N-acyl amino acid synthase FeeM domain-containing protein [Nitrosomonas sp. wSCUT-2]
MEPISDMDMLPIENLPFTVRIINSPDDLQKAADLRRQAYARHIPEFAEQLAAPEAADTGPDTYVLLVESKDDAQEGGGKSLGTMRIHVNRHHPLPLESTIQLPEQFENQTLAEAVRFAITDGQLGQQARNALFKAFYLLCLTLGVDRMIVCARFPLQKLYLGLLFEDLFPAGDFIEMKHIGYIPHRLLMLQVDQVKSIWKANDHFLFHYFFETNHPELNKIMTQSGNLKPYEEFSGAS